MPTFFKTPFVDSSKCSTVNKFTSLLIFFSILVFSSCVTRKDITYFQELDPTKKDTINVDRETDDKLSKLRTAEYDAIIQSGDILTISISSLNPEATSLFTFQASGKLGVVDQSANIASPGFLVDKEGNIIFPVLGTIPAKGRTTIDLRRDLESRLGKYLESPVVAVRYANFKITIMGDVTRPGNYTFANERVTLFEALSTAGDLTIFANRRTVKLIREVNGKNEITTLDLTDKDVIRSKYVYLHPNDLIYVEPGKGKISAADNFYRIMPMILTAGNILALVFWRLGR